MSEEHSNVKERIIRRYGFDLEERTLLVGEGDFGFARSLSDLGFKFLVASDILKIENEKRKGNINALKDSGHVVLIPLDATNKEQMDQIINEHKIECIIWNCPHVCHENAKDKEEFSLVLKFFKLIPDSCKIKMIVTRKCFGKWIGPIAVQTNWGPNLKGRNIPNLEPFESLINATNSSKQEKNFQNYLKHISVNVKLQKFSHYIPTSFGLEPLSAKRYALVEFLKNKSRKRKLENPEEKVSVKKQKRRKEEN